MFLIVVLSRVFLEKKVNQASVRNASSGRSGGKGEDNEITTFLFLLFIF
jgi:hypothetical protein